MPTNNRESKILALSLSLCPGIGGKLLTRILSRNLFLGRSPKEFWELGSESLQEEYRLGQKISETWMEKRESLVQRAKEIQKKIDALGVGFVTAESEDYPEQLSHFGSDPLSLLYLHGNHRLLKAKTFSVLASRNAPPEALEAMEKLVEQGLFRGEVLVAGHNTAEYQRAAVVPLRFGSPRILVLDRELFEALGDELNQEPFRAARLWRHEFDSRVDLALSPLHPEQIPHRGANRLRDRLVVGLSHRLDLVWINPGGNMEQLARAAQQSGKLVRVYDLFPGAKQWERYGAEVIPVG